MAILDASATGLGTSQAAALAVVRMLGSGLFVGSSNFSALGALNQLASAVFAGDSSFDWDFVLEAAATFLGSSAADAEAHRARTASAVFRGESFLAYGTLFPIQGASFVSVSPVVDTHLPPIKGITMGPKTFRWLQLLQRGDLSVFVCDGRNAVIPVRIAYNLAQVRLDGSRKYVGPQNRIPVPGDVGEFYATGRAGESGQPGHWVIEWMYQRTTQSAVQTTEMEFRVVDAVALGDARELLDRRTKWGWS